MTAPPIPDERNVYDLDAMYLKHYKIPHISQRPWDWTSEERKFYQLSSKNIKPKVAKAIHPNHKIDGIDLIIEEYVGRNPIDTLPLYRWIEPKETKPYTINFKPPDVALGSYNCTSKLRNIERRRSCRITWNKWIKLLGEVPNADDLVTI